MTDAAGNRMLELHELLLRLAGQVPDAVLTTAREHLAAGRFTETADAVLPAMTTLASGTGPAVPDAEFTPEPPGPGPVAPLILDLTGMPERLDGPDHAAVTAARAVPDAVALWRAWRGDTPPVRVYLLLTGGDPTYLALAAGGLQSALAGAGVDHPQVEAFHHGTALPRYQQLARGRSALLWTAAATEPVPIARVFDAHHPGTGGQFSADRPTLSQGDELARVLHYLENGTVLLATEARETDPFDESAGPVVPLSFRTDGFWIWTDAVAYFLRTYAVSPDDAFLAHIRAHGYRVGVPDPVVEHRALAALVS